MGLKYNWMQGRWMLAPTTTMKDIGESEIGRGGTEILFPRVDSCTAIAVHGRGADLCGLHLTTIDDEASAARLTALFEADFVKSAQTIIFMGALQNAGTGCGPGSDYRWPKLKKTLKKRLGAKGVRTLGHSNNGAVLDYRVSLHGLAPVVETRPHGGAAPWAQVQPAPL